MSTILAMGAHFDDIEIGVGGTLTQHIEKKDDVYLAVLYVDEFRTGDPADRFKEQYKVMRLLKIPKKNLMCFTSKDSDPDIIASLDVYKPDIIYTSYEDDTHQDHRRCSKIGQSVGRNPRITTFFYGGASVRNFHPNVFVNVDFKMKLKLLKCYKSQIREKAINIERIKRREHYWGTMISKSKNVYAEGFVIHKMEIKI